MWSRRHRQDDDVVSAAQREFEAEVGAANERPTVMVTAQDAARAHARVTSSLAGQADIRAANVGYATHTTFVTTNDVQGRNTRRPRG